MDKIKEFLRSVEGATSIEYGLIASMMAVMAITAGYALSDAIRDVFENGIRAKVDAATAGQP